MSGDAARRICTYNIALRRRASGLESQFLTLYRVNQPRSSMELPRYVEAVDRQTDAFRFQVSYRGGGHVEILSRKRSLYLIYNTTPRKNLLCYLYATYLDGATSLHRYRFPGRRRGYCCNGTSPCIEKKLSNQICETARILINLTCLIFLK